MRIDGVVDSVPDLRLKRIKCVAMEGLIEEEKSADNKLSTLAESGINKKAK
ncbi:hypothetical protein A8O29_013875 [Scandinavium goeteborgense]|nr:hypothetical protein A8O29_013875 [Scandinavium goeteborgense]